VSLLLLNAGHGKKYDQDGGLNDASGFPGQVQPQSNLHF
jgi:hypothetical protein